AAGGSDVEGRLVGAGGADGAVDDLAGLGAPALVQLLPADDDRRRPDRLPHAGTAERRPAEVLHPVPPPPVVGRAREVRLEEEQRLRQLLALAALALAL